MYERPSDSGKIYEGVTLVEIVNPANESPILKKTNEIRRLISAFEKEADKFHDIKLSTFYVTQLGPSSQRKFESDNHTIVLWQYYGLMKPGESVKELMENLQASDLNWGIRGARLSSFAVIEGPACNLFVRMAKRAANLFEADEVREISGRLVTEIGRADRERNPDGKPLASTNGDPLAVWLNYILYHISLTNPGRELAPIVSVDPFSLSLIALERLSEEGHIGRADRSTKKVSEIRFRVAMSFPGERRVYVSEVVDALRKPLGPDTVFYDYDYQAQLARPNLDTLLQNVYRNQSDLLVVFLSSEYQQKEWCGLEWRAVRDIIKAKADEMVMLVRFDDGAIDGVLSIDGYIDARNTPPSRLAELILERLNSMKSN